MAKILLAGSDRHETEVCALVMEFAGYQCTTARSLQKAQRLLRNGSIDLVMADRNLFKGDPAEGIRRLRAASAHTAVVVLTEKSEPGIKADAVLTFPCSPEEFFQAIQRVLSELNRRAGTPFGSLQVPTVSRKRIHPKSASVVRATGLERTIDRDGSLPYQTRFN